MRMQRKTILASVLLLTISFVSMAQGVGNPPPPMPPPPPGLPLDGMFFTIASILLGLYLGIKKIVLSEKR